MAWTTNASTRQDLAVTGGLLILALGWDASALDLPLAHGFGGATGFPLRNHWFLTHVLHDGARYVSWAVAMWLAVAVEWPSGWLARLSVARRVQMVVTPLLAVLLVAGIKSFSATSCPWDLQDFGRVARHIPHWPWAMRADGGSGHCFPAGHASSGFAFMGGWFVLREELPRPAGIWLGVAVTSGLLLGLSQQVRGAHFMSHTLWSAWLCWSVAFAVDRLRQRMPMLSPSTP